MKLRYFSGFAGIGGFDQGIIQVFPEAECIGYSEVDKYAIKIYEKHFPDRINFGDIRRINAETLPDFDLFCGGFPCQDLSIAGKRAGLCGARSGLFFEIIRIIREKQPRLIFLENVKGLFSSNNGWDFARILAELDESGYDVEWQCLNSKNFGVPQNRERVFIIGHLRGKPWNSVFPIGEGNTVSSNSDGREQESEQRICSTIDSRYGALRNAGETYITAIKGDLFSRENPEGQYGFDDENMFCLRGAVNHGILQQTGVLGNDSEATRIYSPDGIARTIKNGGGMGAKTGLYQFSETKIRRLTPLECERLQGYPDFWTEGISDSQRYKCLGNAVTVNVIDAIVRRMHENDHRPK